MPQLDHNDAFHKLCQLASDANAITKHTLVFADDNTDSSAFHVLPQSIQIITQRYEIAHSLAASGYQVICNDFTLDHLPSNSVMHIIMRLPKSKSLYLYLLNQAATLLPPNGTLWIAGYNHEGIQTAIKYAQQRIGSLSVHKLLGKGLRIACLVRSSLSTTALNDQAYPLLRDITVKMPPVLAQQPELAILHFMSKPGIYGFDKIDPGSAFLIAIITPQWLALCQQAATDYANAITHKPQLRVLDLGCGYGYLSMSLLHSALRKQTHSEWLHYYASDNNAAAIKACRHNLLPFQINQQHIVLDDCASTLPAHSIDLIICNPPFHQGFATNIDLSLHFIKQIQRLLKPNARAWIVINRFLKFTQFLHQANICHTIVSQNERFSILELRT